ncbi:Mu transposase C-terminal domain-containing protein [Paraglaciecola aquimarina]|uniref:Mu transposase C-terminal domain-containing protein n=1 Tax=Paraglaciecola aquimarina TaxID=1235557 RepID=A0ABU3SUR4_9ALTE|nr:Mu transposase C-terminal domain-containing protein [Paraglaciecola aquimarina]MDU0353759.1 Mu transposase C-terminal domain-containing protein [Paraglaciecola aquimarina]
MYIVVDVFSHLITGYYIGLHAPSYRTGSIALLSAVQDKTHLLDKYNIAPEICSKWPGTGLPSSLLSDKAEFFGESGSHLVEATGIRMENTGSGRSDMKPFCERYLGLIQQPFSGSYPGKSNKVTNKKAGAIDGRLNAVLTLPEFEEIVVSEIILINNCRIMKEYDCEKDLPDDLPRTPINVWNWGIANRSGQLTKVDEENLKIAVLPKDTASVSQKGVYFKKLFYFSEELENLSWFIRIRNNRARPDKVEVHFDPMTVNQIYLILPDGCTKTITCLLKPQSRQFKDCSFREVQLRTSKQADTAYNTENYEEARRVIEEKALSIQKNAEKRKKQQTNKKSAAQTKRDIPRNKELARNEERQKLIEDFSPQQFEVLLDETDLGQLSTQDEFGNPELDELFNLRNGKDVKNETNGIDDE